LVLGAMNADLRPAGVAGPTRKARWLDPWTWQRNSVTWSGFALVIRTGRFRREIDLVPHARIQDLNARQGPLERRFGLASVLVSSMPGPVLPQVAHLDAADAAAFLAAETPRIWFPAVSPPA
jgi:putative membrane protein